MTSRIGSAATAKTMQRITGPSGIQAGLASLTQGDRSGTVAPELGQIRAQNVAADLAERSSGVKYPAVNVYCQRIANEQREKFRKFSGRVFMAVEVRHSQDRLDGLEGKLQTYADAVTQTLQGSLGDWGDGMFFGGAYEVAFGAVKHGGQNFLQAATVTFALEVSK